MKILKIRRKYCLIEVMLDDEDFERMSKYDWKLDTQTNKVYRRDIRKVDNWRIKSNILLHRQIMGIDDNHKVIFKDGNTFNCQKTNLQIINDSRKSPHYKEPDCSNNGAHHHKIRKLFEDGEAVKRPTRDRWTYYDDHNRRVNQHGEIQERWYLDGDKWKTRWRRPNDD